MKRIMLFNLFIITALLYSSVDQQASAKPRAKGRAGKSFSAPKPRPKPRPKPKAAKPRPKSKAPSAQKSSGKPRFNAKQAKAQKEARNLPKANYTAPKKGKLSPEGRQDLTAARDSLKSTGKLPNNYVPKRDLGPGKLVDGGKFGNKEGKLPKGKWNEADIGWREGGRGKERLLYTDDKKKMYYTNDHYNSFKKVKQAPFKP